MGGVRRSDSTRRAAPVRPQGSAPPSPPSPLSPKSAHTPSSNSRSTRREGNKYARVAPTRRGHPQKSGDSGDGGDEVPDRSATTRAIGDVALWGGGRYDRRFPEQRMGSRRDGK